MWVKIGDDMSKRSWVIEGHTDKQMDKQTFKRTYLQISSKFWQVVIRGQKMTLGGLK